MTVNGHCTYLPGNKYILNDTYPDKDRRQNPYLYEISTNRRIPLGAFYSPKEYVGEWRCDDESTFQPGWQKSLYRLSTRWRASNVPDRCRTARSLTSPSVPGMR